MGLRIVTLLGLIALASPSAGVIARPLPTAAPVLRQASVACGEARLLRFSGIRLAGQAERFGLRGRFSELVDLRTGCFFWQADYGVSGAAEGLDAGCRWRMDASRRVHPLDSHEAKTVALTEAYLARRGYLHSEPAHLALADEPSGSQRYDLVAATPPGGRTALLWIDRTDHLVHRIDIQLSERSETVRYDDYRRVGGVELPFSIRINDGDEPATVCVAVASYRLLAHVRQAAFQPPAEELRDTRIMSGAGTPLRVDQETGFPIVFAKINGHGLSPFIVDTGGHDILTPAAARRFGLKTTGHGISFGAGAGSTSTAFTRIHRVSVGGAEMRDQPFVVLDLPLGTVSDAQGQRVPITGILGLELFERFAVTLNFPRGILVAKRGSETHDISGTALPIRFTSDEPLVSAQIDGRAGSFAVDTGNNVGLIVSEHWLTQTGMSPLRLNPGRTMGDSIGGGVSFRHGQAESVRLGAFSLPRVPLFISDAHVGSLSSRSEAGSIGISILARFCVTFEYAAGRMVLRRK